MWISWLPNFFFWKVLIFHQPWWGFPSTVPPCDLIHDETFYPLTSTDRHAAKWASLVGLRIKQQGPCSNPFGLFLSKIFKQGMFEKNEFPFRSLKEKTTCSKCFSTGKRYHPHWSLPLEPEILSFRDKWHFIAKRAHSVPIYETKEEPIQWGQFRWLYVNFHA